MGNEKYVCDICGSDRVYFEAWVGVNNREDIDIFPETVCKNCSGECLAVTEEAYKQNVEE